MLLSIYCVFRIIVKYFTMTLWAIQLNSLIVLHFKYHITSISKSSYIVRWKCKLWLRNKDRQIIGCSFIGPKNIYQAKLFSFASIIFPYILNFMVHPYVDFKLEYLNKHRYNYDSTIILLCYLLFCDAFIRACRHMSYSSCYKM